MTLTETMVRICREALPARAGPDALAAARRCLVDSLAVAYAAAGQRAIDLLREAIAKGDALAESTLIGTGIRIRADSAALINGMMISLLLFDDNHGPMRGHPSAPVLPVVLALGESEDRSLVAALTAFVAGYEVECRLGELLNPSHYEIGWHATSTQGTMGATVAAALLLGLAPEQMACALGIAASLTGGLRRNFGTMTMSLHSGEAASTGIRAARLAARGFTADPHIFDGAMSFGEVFSREWDPAHFAESLRSWGDPFAIVSPGPIFKLCPCGWPAIPAVEGVMALQRKHGLDPARIDRIVCDVSFMYPRTLIHSEPRTGLQGKTSLQYCVAATLIDGQPRMSSFTDEAVRREEIRALIQRTEVRVPPELSEHVPEVRKRPFEQPVTITIHTRDGAAYSETVLSHKGTAQNPVDDNDLRRKFEECTANRFKARQVDEILNYIQRDDATARGLFRLLEAPNEAPMRRRGRRATDR